MKFVVEKVPLDSFYINLLLGIPRILNKNKKIGIRRKVITKFPPAQPSDINEWQNKHGVSLPDDLRNFYLSTNGFLFKWICTYGMHQQRITCKIEINSLENFIHLVGFRMRSESGVYLDGPRYKLRLGQNSRIFELFCLNDGSKVTLVYLTVKFLPTVWLCTTDLDFYYLADNFTTYFRMAVAHLGLPNWQLLYTDNGIPQWSRILMRLVAPTTLIRNKQSPAIEMMKKERSKKKRCKYAHLPKNKFDVSIFNGINNSLGNTSMEDKNIPSVSQKMPPKKKQSIKSRYLQTSPYRHTNNKIKNIK